MHSQPTRRRETFLSWFLAIAFGCLIVLCTLMLTGRLLFALLAVSAGMVFYGFLHYLIWGRPARRPTEPPPRETL